jgi:hypothetical protein
VGLWITRTVQAIILRVPFVHRWPSTVTSKPTVILSVREHGCMYVMRMNENNVWAYRRKEENAHARSEIDEVNVNIMARAYRTCACGRNTSMVWRIATWASLLGACVEEEMVQHTIFGSPTCQQSLSEYCILSINSSSSLLYSNVRHKPPCRKITSWLVVGVLNGPPLLI